jgi:predicted nucleic-acid-binding Zn-ribbon protein
VPAPTCPKCGIGLQEGFILDQTRNSRVAAEWVEGQPERSFWLGLKLKGRKKLAISGHRCPRCGYLELYAPVEQPKG